MIDKDPQPIDTESTQTRILRLDLIAAKAIEFYMDRSLDVLSREKLMEVIALQTEIAQFGLDLDNVMGHVVERTLGLVDADGAAIQLIEGQEMVYRCASGSARSQIGTRVKREGSLSGLCVENGTPVRCDDSEKDPRADSATCRRDGLRSMLFIPLIHQGVTVGVLKVMSAQPRKFGDIDATLLELISGLLSASMYFAAKYSSDKLFQLATHDGLTGLVNRSHFMDRLRNAMALSLRDKRPLAVMIVDMDDLKKTNDAYGHAAGDALLKEFADRLKASIRATDTVARLGGDEFALILTPIEPPYGSYDIMKRIEDHLMQPFVFNGIAHDLRASIGVAQFPDDARDIEQLLAHADHRMYAIKRVKKR